MAHCRGSRRIALWLAVGHGPETERGLDLSPPGYPSTDCSPPPASGGVDGFDLERYEVQPDAEHLLRQTEASLGRLDGVDYRRTAAASSSSRATGKTLRSGSIGR